MLDNWQRGGSHVVINYSRNEEGARHTQQACEAYGVETLVVKANVVDDEECRAMVDTALDKWGRVDALINNAGTTKFNPHQNLEGLSKQDFINIYAVNTLGPYQMTKAVVEAMKTGGRGSIVNVASVSGITGVGSSVCLRCVEGCTDYYDTFTSSCVRSRDTCELHLPRAYSRWPPWTRFKTPITIALPKNVRNRLHLSS